LLARLAARAARWHLEKRWTLSLGEDRLFLLLAVIIGVYAGLAVVCFRMAIEWVRWQLLSSALTPSGARVVVAPVVVGLIVAALVIHVFRRVRGSGVNQTKEAMYVSDGYVPFSTVTGKFVTCSLAIGSGQSLGPEDPSLQIGAGIASALGRKLRLSREKIRLIAPVGAAAGLAAAFNAPIAAIIFVIEEVIGKWSAGVLGAIVLSSVSSVVVERWFLGSEPLFRVPLYQLVHPAELLAYSLLGIVGGFYSLAFVKLVTYFRPRLKALPTWTRYFQPAAAGFVIGIIALWVPQVMGAGYEVMDQAMNEQYTWRLLALFAACKMLATCLSFVSGTPGGLFAPTLFMGAMLGGAIGGLEGILFPRWSGPVGAYALVGMGTLFAGILRSPMTAVFMVLEVSGRYSIILPVMISSTIAYLISRRHQPAPIFDVLARQDGVDLPSLEEEREESTLRVEDAMRPPVGLWFRAQESVGEALRSAEESAEPFFLVGDGVGGWSGVAKETLRAYAQEGNGSRPLSSLMPSNVLPRLHPDQPLDTALRQIGDWPLLPVVHRADSRRLEGVISLADILRAYRRPGVT
jgi:CIC family chloride channel protein